MISVVQLGLVDYATGLRLQQTLVEMRKAGRVSDALLLLEHTPVITLGRNARTQNVIAPPELLARQGVEQFECDRGGDVTFHGPGQLVGYPIFDLRAQPAPDGQRRTLGAVEYVRRLEEVLIRVSADWGIATERVPKMTGVWTRPSAKAAQAKMAAIGVHISRGITSHGFALNVNTNLDYFKLIVPCGLADKPVTSMAQQTGGPVAMDDVAESVARNFGLVFQSQVLWVETLDALLGRTVGVPLKLPAELEKLHSTDKSANG